MNIVIPIAGEGRRFVEAGFPEKPFVDLDGKPLIETVIRGFPKPWIEKGNFVIVTRSEFISRLKPILNQIGIKYRTVEVSKTTKGAASTVLLSQNVIDTVERKNPLVIVNGDQIVRFSLHNFNTLAECLRLGTYASDITGIIPVFKASGNKWSYTQLDNYKRVVYVAEKEPVSEWATCGIYYWSNTQAFYDCAENMIYNERRVNNEYYVAPVYNEIVKYKFRNGIVFAFEVDEMIGLGTPEDVKEYLGRQKGEW